MSLTFNSDTHEYRWEGNVVPSVTQILKPIKPDYSAVRSETLEHARQLGIAVDSTITLFEQGILDATSLSDTLKPYLEAWNRFKSVTQFKVLGVQKMVYHKMAHFAGTLDVVGEFPGEGLSIIDIKRTFAIPAHAGPQTAAYAHAWGGNPRRFALHFKSKQEKYDHITWGLKSLSDRNDLNVFLSCLVIHRFKESH